MKEISPEARKMISNYVRMGARMMATLIAELDNLTVDGVPQNRELTEYLMEKFNAKFEE